jgi:signal transduction histidine kinase
MLWAFGGTVAASCAAVLTLSRTGSTVSAMVCGTTMLVLATRNTSVPSSRILPYFVVQSFLAASILVVMPLLSQLTLVAPRRTVMLYGVACAAVFAASFVPHATGLAAISGQLVAFLAAAIFTVVFTEVALRERQARSESERLAAELGAAQSRIAELAVADERVRLAHEIHDGLGHALTAARMQLEGAAAVLEHDPARAKHALQKASRLVRDGLADVRQSVRALRPGADAPSLDERLARLLRENPSDVTVELEIRGEPRLSPAEQHALYRVAQEALTNVERHAAASRVTLKLDCRQSETILELTDDGRGMGDAAFGVGLTGMHERLARLDGTLEVGQGALGGVTVRAVLPTRARPTEPT